MNDTLPSRFIAHEIRNHLSICELYTQVIRKNLEKENLKNASVQNALGCIEKSLKIISNSLLDLKSIDNFNPKPCDLKSLVEESIELSKIYASGKKINFTCDINQTADIYADENKFLACLVNIMKNAAECIEKQGKIGINAGVSGNTVHIKISNNGKEIPKEKQQDIFEEGFTTKPSGSGLGLYICSNNLKMQNAELKLNFSTPEMTEFEIIIPVYHFNN